MEQTTITPQELSNDTVRFTIHHKPNCIVEYDVEAYEKLAQEGYRLATKKVAKEVSLPGFRKGKVPDEMVVKNFSQEIDKQAQQEIATLSYQACQTLSPIRPLHTDGKVKFTMKTHSKTGALLILSFEMEPVIPSVDPAGFIIKPIKRPEVNPEKVEETIRQIQLFFAQWQTVSDRPVANGDFVRLNVDVIEDVPPSPLFSDTRFEVAEKSMAKWMHDLVLGKNVGDALEGMSMPDETASEEDKESLKPKKVRVTIQSIDIPTIPDLDEAFIQSLGVSTQEELRTNITRLLNKQADAHVQEGVRSQANDFLLTQYPFDLPATLVLEETRFRFKQLSNDHDFLEYWNHLGQEERNKSINLIHSQAEKAVRLFYLCRKIINDAKISITTADIPAPASNALELLLNPQKIHHHQRTPEVEHAEAYSRILLEKAEDYLIAHASSAQ
jgi:trigger factor